MTTASFTPPPTASVPPTLLIVDDEEGPRQSLRMVFKKDFNAVAIEDGDQALELARQHPVHIAILDIRMAGKSGIDVLRGLKAIDPHIEVIMLTAYETIETARQALRLGACDYLSKPFELSTIREAVNRALYLRRVSESIAATVARLNEITAQLNDASLREEMARTTNEIYAGVLHDINNPLTIITGYVELLGNRLAKVGSLHGADLESVRTDIASLTKQVNTCAAITRRYLRFLRGRQSSASEVSVNQVLTDVQTMLRTHPAGRKSRLAVKHLDIDAVAQIGGTEIVQILLNLILNAFQCTARSQTVWLTAERFDIPLPLELHRDGDRERFHGLDAFINQPPFIALSVLDQGPGIPPDVLSRIFEPYFTTKAQDGTGIGLAIVSRLVKSHHGLIHVKTRADEGTRFTVYLPARKEPVAQTADPFSAGGAL
ncbi:MAG: response regulator [Opitutaceae bacterium]|nr:response regulator [Opitutaceae bacterium]